MTNEQLKQTAEAMLAHLEGEDIEARPLNRVIPSDSWVTNSAPHWALGQFEYRKKPQMRECWINIYTDGDWIFNKKHSNREDAINGVAGHKNYIETIKFKQVEETE